MFHFEISFQGTPHELLSLDDLVLQLTRSTHDLTTKLIKKEEELADLYKETSRILADYGSGTESMIELLHKTRDEQACAVYTYSMIYALFSWI